MVVTRAVEIEGPQPTVPRTSSPTDKSNVRPPPLPSMRVQRSTASARANDTQELADVKSGVKSVKPRTLDAEVGREWALRAAETKARIAAAEEREWQVQLARVKATQADAEEAEWRTLRDQAALAEQREWEVAMARARAAAVSTPRAKPPARPSRPSRPSTVSQPVAVAPVLAPTVSSPVPPSAAPAVTFSPFGHVTQAAPVSGTPRGHVVSWP